MKPVEIEIFLQDGLTPGLEKASRSLEVLSGTSRRAMSELNTRVRESKSLIRDMEGDIRKLERSLDSATPGTPQFGNLQSELSAARRALEEEQNALREYQGNLEAAMAARQQQGGSLRTQLRETREEIATLLLAYRSLTDAEKQTAQGRELARHIDELTEKAGELNDALADTSQAVNNAASDTRAFDQLAGGMQLVVDGFGLATAGAQALGLSEADLLEVQTRLQTALVASNALTSAQTNLQRQSALMQGVSVIQTKAAAAAENARTWAVGRGVIATKAATVAQAAFNTVAKANPYVVLAAAVVTVVGALYAFAKGSSEAKKAEEERQAQMEKARQRQEEYRRVIVDTAGTQVASYLRLKSTWESLGDSFDKKRKFIHDTKDAWRNLGKEIGTVNDMELMFRDHTKDMLNAIINRAQLKAYEARIQNVADQMVDDIEKHRTFKITKVESGVVSSSSTMMGRTSYSEAQHLTPQERQAVKGHITFSSSGTYGSESIDEEGARIINEMRRAQGSTAALQAQAQARQKAQEEIGRYVNEMSALNDRFDKIMESVPGRTVDPNSTSDRTPTPTSDPAKDTRLENERRVFEELQKLRWQNDQEEIDQKADSAEKRRQQIDLDHEKELAEIEKQRQAFAAANAEAGTEGLNAAGLTEDQQEEIDRANRLAVESRDKALEEMYRSEAQHMADYLKEYGTFQQRRAAIAEDYDRRIAVASDEWSRKALEREKAATLQNVEVEAIKQSIDWGSVFGDFGTLFRDQLEPTIEKLRAITQTEEFKNTNLEDKQTLYELISKLEQANTSWNNDIFATLGEDLIRYQSAMRDYMAAQDAERAATDALAQAKERLAKAEASGDGAQIAVATRGVVVATNNLNVASEHVADFGTQVQDASGKLQTSTATVNNMFNSLASNLAGLKSGNLQGIGESLMGLDKLFNNSKVTSSVGSALAKGMSKLLGSSDIGKSVAQALGNSGLLGQIISAILSILDILKDGIGALVSNLLDTVLNAVSGILKNVLDGQMFVQIGKSLIDGIGGIFDAITFGGFSKWISGSNADQVRGTIDRLTERNTLLQGAIENLTGVIKASKGTQSVEAYRRARDLQQETNDNYLSMAMAQAGYHNAHHSWNYYWEGFSQEQINRLSGQINRQWDGNIWSLSPEEMQMLRSNVDMWQQILDTGEGGYGERVGAALTAYMDQAGKLEELTNQLHEGLTGMSFDSMYDSFVDRLMDMELKAEDVADDISEYFMRAWLSNKVGELFADDLEKWWHKFGEGMEDGNLDAGEIDELSEEYMGFVERAIQLRDQLAAATGYDPNKNDGGSQSGRPGSFNALSQEQGTKLEGLFVSVQGHVANIDTAVEDVVEKMNRAESYLAEIADNTKSNAKSAEEIRDMIKQMLRDGIKLN